MVMTFTTRLLGPAGLALILLGGVFPSALSAAEPAEVPAYNAPWPKGRGFGVGQTVPDIPLINLKGEEVRFSRFLGKQYIVYCWASW
jgi:hypothetical protein